MFVEKKLSKGIRFWKISLAEKVPKTLNSTWNFFISRKLLNYWTEMSSRRDRRRWFLFRVSFLFVTGFDFELPYLFYWNIYFFCTWINVYVIFTGTSWAMPLRRTRRRPLPGMPPRRPPTPPIPPDIRQLNQTLFFVLYYLLKIGLLMVISFSIVPLNV